MVNETKTSDTTRYPLKHLIAVVLLLYTLLIKYITNLVFCQGNSSKFYIIQQFSLLMMMKVMESNFKKAPHIYYL